MPRSPRTSMSSYRNTVPTPASPLFSSSGRSRVWSLSRPLPLLPLAAADFSYAVYHALRHATPGYLTALAGVRTAVLAFILVPSLRWRLRGSWLVAAAGATLIACVWEGAFFLIITSAIAVFEYVFFLLLVRLVPQTRTPPFSLRGPPPKACSEAGRSPSIGPLSPSLTPKGAGRTRRFSQFAGQNGFGPNLYTTPAPGTPGSINDRTFGSPDANASRLRGETCSPWSVRQDTSLLRDYDQIDEESVGHDRSQITEHELDDQGGDSSFAGSYAESYGDTSVGGNLRWASRGTGDIDHFNPNNGHPELYSRRFDEEMGLGDEDYQSDTDSTISDSSIIDLPPPARPTPVVLKDGSSISAGLNLAAGVAGAGADAVGELVRRSASARFLGRSLGSNSDAGDSNWGYGTFASRG